MTLLDGRTIVVTGLLTRQSLAYAVAETVMRLGADVILTNAPGRRFALMNRSATLLPQPPTASVPADLSTCEGLEELRAEAARHWTHVDGVLHAVAYAPPSAMDGDFLAASWEDVAIALRVSVFSLRDIVATLRPLLRKAPDGGSVVSLDFDASVAWPTYQWMGVAKAALEAITRYLAQALGAEGIRVNTVAAGPLGSPAGRGVPGLSLMAHEWSRRAPLGWDVADASPVAGAVAFLLSPLARGVTGTVVHADGGFHATGMTRPARQVP